MVSPAEPVTTRVSVAGFDSSLSSPRNLADFLEAVAGRVWRCRVKTTCTPPDSYPDFQCLLPAANAPPPPPPRSSAARRRRVRVADGEDDVAAATPTPTPCRLVPPHAFVHFVHQEAARRAARCGLVVRAPSAQSKSGALRAARRQNAKPFRFADSCVQAGNLCAPDAFIASWRCPEDGGSSSGLDFVVDPLDDSCRLVFSRDTAFAFPATRAAAVVLCCDFKIEFFVDDIAEVLVFRADDSLLLRLSAAPLLYYRTAADGVHQSVPFDLLDDDDDDPWIRTTDITTGGAIGRCWMYRISFNTWLWPTMNNALAYMKGKRVPVCDIWCPGFRVHDELEFGKPMQGLFLCVQRVEELEFPVLFLVNVLLHKGILNEHQLTSSFFGLLKREEEHVNVAALTELLGENCQVFDVCQRLENMQDKVAKNPKLLHPRSSCNVAGDYNAVVRRLVITPTRAYCMPPQVERSNRVIRHYHHVADRFLRVTFMDEGMQLLNINALNFGAAPIVQNLMSKSFQYKTSIYRRVQMIMTKGFHLCGRN